MTEMIMNRELYPAVILAGGRATRLGTLTRSMPKALIEVNGQPFIVHQLRLLADRGIRKIVLCVGHLGEQIVQRVGNGKDLGLTIQYAFDGPRLLGTAGAIKQALSKIDGPTFFVLYGDSYLDCDYAAVQAAFQSSDKSALMTVYRNAGRWDTSNVEFSESRILAYDKKSPTEGMQHIDYGLGVFDKNAFNNVPVQEPIDLATLYQEWIRADQLVALEIFQRFYEIGSPAGLEETRKYLASRPSSASSPPAGSG
jgi:NDP-sugar pyrophosphorylase family protein